MKATRFLILTTLAAAIFTGGCNTSPYAGPEPIPGPPDALSEDEKRIMVMEALDQLLKDPTFSRVYAEKKDMLAEVAAKSGKKAKLPLIAMDILHNRTKNGVSDGEELGQVSRDLQRSLRQTDLFDVTDDFISLELLERILTGTDTIYETGGTKHLGTFDAPNLWLTGYLTRKEEPKLFVFSLNLELTDTATKRVFWDTTITRRKKR